MIGPSLCSALSELAPVSLDELIDQAGLLTRVDRKYLLPVGEVAALVAGIGEGSRVLEIAGLRSFQYESVYFDTPDLMSFRQAAHRRRRRFKVRTRTYLDSCQCWLEVKTRGARASTVKNRHPYDPTCRDVLGPGRWYVDTVLAKMSISDCERMVFEPTLITRYRRSTLFLPSSGSRVTIDTDLLWDGGDGRRLLLPGLAVVETKTGSTPSHVDRALWQLGHRPVRLSKYATGLAALRPELPATPWRRTMRWHLATAIRPVAPACTTG